MNCYSNEGFIDLLTNWRTAWPTDRQTDRRITGQTNRQTDRQTHRLTIWQVDWCMNVRTGKLIIHSRKMQLHLMISLRTSGKSACTRVRKSPSTRRRPQVAEKMKLHCTLKALLFVNSMQRPSTAKTVLTVRSWVRKVKEWQVTWMLVNSPTSNSPTWKSSHPHLIS